MTTRTDRQPQRAAETRRRSHTSRRSGVGGTLVGIFIGVALGLALAAGVAFYLLKAGNPYLASGTPRDTTREATKDTSKSVRSDATGAEKPRFDFYKILPGGEEPKTAPRTTERATADRATVERAATIEKAPPPTVAKADERTAAVPDKAVETAPRAPRSGERIWLQAGSFASEGDAENLKAQLAMAGMEASLQQATLPDKGVRYRVRLGPYDNVDEVNRVKNDLAKRGFDVSVIR